MINNEQFNLATGGNTYNVVPLVAIVSNTGLEGSFLSTQNITLNAASFLINFDPLLLNISSIKESVDVETRKYKVSSVTLTLSNAKYLGKRLSDSYIDLINGDVEVRFKTQNVTDYNRTMLVYKGKVRRITQSDTTLTLSVEDSSEQKVHKDIPESIAPETDFKSKYKNKPYPMVIGKVDRSPCITSFNTTSEYDIDNDGVLDDYNFVRDVIADKKELSKIVPENLEIGNNIIGSPSLYAEVDEEYVGLYPRTVIDFDSGLEAGDINYSTLATNNGFCFVELFDNYDGEIEDIEEIALNDTAANKGRVLMQRKESKIERIIKERDTDGGFTFKSGYIDLDENGNEVLIEDASLNFDRINDGNSNTCIEIEGNWKKIETYTTIDEDGNESESTLPFFWYSLAYLKFHFDSLPSGITLEIEGDAAASVPTWNRIISKIQILNRELKQFFHQNTGSISLYLPLIAAFGNQSWGRLFANTNYNNCYLGGHSDMVLKKEEDSDGRFFYKAPETPSNEWAGNGHKEHTFATGQEMCNSFDGDDPISVIHPYLIPNESNFYYLGLPHIATIGRRQVDGMADFVIKNYDIPVKFRIFESQLWAFGTLDNLLEKNFYANVWGRPSDINNYFIRTLKSFFPLGGGHSLGDLLNIIKESSNTTNNTPSSDDDIEYPVYPIKAIQGDKEVNITSWHFRIKNILNDSYSWFRFSGLTSDDVFGSSFDIQLGNSNGEVVGDPITINFDGESERIDMNPLESPAEIVQHILEEECKYDGGFNEEEFNAIEELHPDWTFAFTQKELIDSKELIEDFSRSTKSFPRFRADGTFGWNVVKDTYSEDMVDLTIEESDIINYKYSRTKLEDVKTNIKVLFNKDYAKGNHLYSTDEISMNSYPDYDYDYYGLSDDDSDSTLNFESDYIRDRYTAEQLRDWLVTWHMNQKNLISLTLPIKYLKLEVGDVVAFDKEIQDTKIFGETYTETSINRNGQEIYPYFMVYETNKNLDKVDIKVIQLHNLDINSLITEDAETSQDSNVVIPTGDVNGDGKVDIIDIVSIIAFTLGNKEPSEQEFFEADVNQDGEVNILDIVYLVNVILG